MTIQKKVLEIIQEHYQNSPKPLLLAELGKLLRERGIWPQEGASKKLSEFLGSLSPMVEVQQDPHVPAFRFVVIPEAKEQVAKAVELRNEISFLKRIPRSMLIAFAVETPQALNLYLQTVPPYRYRVTKTPPSEDFVEIGQQYRSPGLDVEDIDKIPAHLVEDLVSKIENWLAEQQLTVNDFQIFDKTAVGKKELQQDSVNGGGTNMLERLRAAQREGIAEQMVIPFDIAVLLSRTV